METIAATSTLAMVRTAAGRGVETADLLDQAGLTLEVLEDPDQRISAPTVLALWDALRERTADPALQLAAPATLPFGAYRVIDYLVAASATVGDGIRRFARFFGLITRNVTLRTDRDDEEHALCLGPADGVSVPPAYVDYVFAALVTRIRMRIRPDLRVRRVLLSRDEPVQTAPYRELFRSPVLFGAAEDRLCFTDREWQAPTVDPDEALAELLEEHARILAQRVPEPATGFRAEVESVLAGALPEGGTAAEVARRLYMSVRTLQRKLADAGTSFREVSETVRAQLAVSYLADPTVSIAEVAFLLGFSETSAFNRAFRRWTGEPPGRWRRRRLDGARAEGTVTRL